MLSINPFDAAVYICLLVAVVAGYRSGLLRSLATIFGYVMAAPLAVAAAPYLSSILVNQFHLPQAQAWLGFAGIFLVFGFGLSAMLRHAVGEVVGPNVSLPDRLSGAILGAVRIGCSQC
jgi:membrane protein required for colicin V production